MRRVVVSVAAATLLSGLLSGAAYAGDAPAPPAAHPLLAVHRARM